MSGGRCTAIREAITSLAMFRGKGLSQYVTVPPGFADQGVPEWMIGLISGFGNAAYPTEKVSRAGC